MSVLVFPKFKNLYCCMYQWKIMCIFLLILRDGKWKIFVKTHGCVSSSLKLYDHHWLSILVDYTGTKAIWAYERQKNVSAKNVVRSHYIIVRLFLDVYATHPPTVEMYFWGFLQDRGYIINLWIFQHTAREKSRKMVSSDSLRRSLRHQTRFAGNISTRFVVCNKFCWMRKRS